MTIQKPLGVSQGLATPPGAPADAADDPAGGPYEGIGTTLAAAREQAGLTLADVARKTCIRQDYLEAIETGNFGALPGRIYSVGFVKTYAASLGLDPMLACESYKREAADTGMPEKLIFPVPTPERRTPRRNVIIVALVAAGAVYGGWLYLGGDERQTADRVSAVPAHIAAKVAEPPAAPETPPSAPSAPAAVPAETRDSAAAPAVPAGGASPSPPPVARLPAPEPPPPEPVAVAPEVPRPVAKPAITPTQRLRLLPPAIATEPGTATAAASAAPADSESEEAATEPPSPVAAGEPPAAAEPAPVPSVPPAAMAAARDPGLAGLTGGAHIVITAKSDSWLQIEGPNGQTVISRLLKAGESVRLPNQPGLILMTGDAGALDVSVDGENVPALGPPGAVRRNISLAPDRLRAGTAGGQ